MGFSSSRRGGNFKVFIIIAVVLFAVVLLIQTVFVKSTKEIIVVTVTDKDRIVETDNDDHTSSKYLIFTDKETFECTDEIAVGKFNSSDFYGQIHKDSTYEFTVYGWRIPFLSSYRNIIEFKKIKK